MHITNMAIGGVPPFTQAVEFEFDERVNLFVGPNASGKSTILRVMSPWFPANAIPGYHDGNITVAASPDWPVRSDRSIDDDAVPQVYIPAARLGMPYSITNAKVVTHMGGLTDWDNILSEAPYRFFDGERVYHAMRKLSQEGGLFQDMSVATALHIAAHSYECAKSVCDDVLAGDTPEHYTTTQSLDAGMGNHIANLPCALRNIPVLHYAMGATTVDDNNAPIYVGDLSSGTQITYLTIWYLAFRIAHSHNFEMGWESKSAVLFIDEIENHLHPTWQRRVIPALLKHFPGLQIFATTHSPFVIAGLKAGQVHLLNRDAKGVITATSNTEDIIGWTADEILRVFMGVDDPTDDATAAAARELRQLRDADPHPDEHQEEQRQARMQELRQQVDRNLLAGGPRAAEEERFAENLTRILEKYRLTKDLNQENG